MSASLFFCTHSIRNQTVSIKSSQQFWKFWRKFKNIVRLVYEVSSFIVLLMSFEKAFMLKTWSVVKTWQITRLAEKFPRLLRTVERTFATA